MVTYLLSAGYSPSNVGLVRTLAVVFEILATWVAPWLMGWIGPIRAGAWLLNAQLVCLVTGITLFWVFEDKPIISASALVGSTIVSRLGLRGFDLCAQLIVQDVRFSSFTLSLLMLPTLLTSHK
jgi:iron-regulated transporter 1